MKKLVLILLAACAIGSSIQLSGNDASHPRFLSNQQRTNANTQKRSSDSIFLTVVDITE